jgi:AhpD family alkylhydroperoxidase
VFTRRVETVPGLPCASGTLRLAHPVAGQLRLAYEVLEVAADDLVHLRVSQINGCSFCVDGGLKSLRHLALGERRQMRAALAAVSTFPEAPLTMALTRDAAARNGLVVDQR